MTGFDIVILAVVAISALLAFARGFVREALSMAAMFIAILAVLWGFPLLRMPMRGLIETGWLADAATIGSIFILVYIAVRVATGRLHEWVHDSEPLGILDRTAGLLFGVARGFVLMAVAALVVNSVAPPSMLPKSLKEAQFYPIVMLTADGLKHLAPQAGKAATTIARNAKSAGEDMAGVRRGPTNGLTSSVDGGQQKEEGSNGRGESGYKGSERSPPVWNSSRSSDQNSSSPKQSDTERPK
jgi:membrane protein required for colicin V production